MTEEVTRSVAATTFRGARVTNEFPGRLPCGNYQFFIQYAIPGVQADLLGRVRNEEAMYNAFRASQAFQALDFAVQQHQGQ
jgi:hypothetical protein